MCCYWWFFNSKKCNTIESATSFLKYVSDYFLQELVFNFHNQHSFFKTTLTNNNINLPQYWHDHWSSWHTAFMLMLIPEVAWNIILNDFSSTVHSVYECYLLKNKQITVNKLFSCSNPYHEAPDMQVNARGDLEFSLLVSAERWWLLCTSARSHL